MRALDWSPLRKSLKAYRAGHQVPHIWWRDDDAIAPTAALDHLAADAEDLRLKVHLAVIPANASEALASRCSGAPFLPVVHGWRHADHSQPGEKKNEFLTPRPDAHVDAANGLERLQHLFDRHVAPMFVPPWNRIGAEVVAGLADMGYTHLSTFTPRATAEAAPRLRQVNTHLDPIDWKGSRGLVDPDTLIAQAAHQLVDRLEGRADPSEPYGLLTHHLVHNRAIWDFSKSFLAEMLHGGATPWQMETRHEQT